MFRRSVEPIDQVLNQYLRRRGMETPLLQKRLMDAWDMVAGHVVARYTTEKFIKNQTLFVRIVNPALKQDLSMMRAQLVGRLNAAVGSGIITDIRIY